MLGNTVSHYRITGKLGTGGMGIVYEAEDMRLARKVALKFLPEESADDPDAERRFQREADTIAQLNHAHICTIYEIDRHEGRTFIAMECVEGVNLKVYMTRHALTTERIVEIALQITAALGAAHARGIVHRAIKPGNIIVSDTGHVKVFPFGQPIPDYTTVNFNAGQTRTNNGILALGTSGMVTVMATMPTGGTTDFVLDVTGYFR